MALTDKLTAIADAIRARTGESGTMTLGEMPGKIAAISGGSLQESKAVTITSNGTTNVTPDDGYDGMQSVAVTVNVAEEAALPVAYSNSTGKDVKAVIWGKSYYLKAKTNSATPLDGNPKIPPSRLLEGCKIHVDAACTINLTKTFAAIIINIING